MDMNMKWAKMSGHNFGKFHAEARTRNYILYIVYIILEDKTIMCYMYVKELS